LRPSGGDAPILAVGPFLAALVMLALVGGRPALRAWLAKIVDWRVGLRWYAFALLVPLALTCTAAAITFAIGAPSAAGLSLPTASDWVLQFALVLLLIGVGEEPAWRGYALPRLMAGRSALTAAVILGLLHTVRHLPLFGVEYDLDNGPPWVINVVCFSIITAWMWLHTGGILLLPILLHTVINAVNPLVWRWFDGTDRLYLWWIWAGLWALLTAAIIAVSGPSLTRNNATLARCGVPTEHR